MSCPTWQLSRTSYNSLNKHGLFTTGKFVAKIMLNFPVRSPKATASASLGNPPTDKSGTGEQTRFVHQTPLILLHIFWPGDVQPNQPVPSTSVTISMRYWCS